MTRALRMRVGRARSGVCALFCVACGAAATSNVAPDTTPTADIAAPAPAPKESPPASGTPREVRFPPIARVTTDAGLELDSVELKALPVAYATLVLRSGSAADPAALPGLARLTAAMLKEGTRKRSSAQLAEAIEFLGARLDVRNDEENVYIDGSALSEHFEKLLDLMAEVALEPAFDDKELAKLKKRELARLAL